MSACNICLFTLGYCIMGLQPIYILILHTYLQFYTKYKQFKSLADAKEKIYGYIVDDIKGSLF